MIKANVYQQIDDNRDWPADIRWIRDSLKLQRGTPRYIVAADGKVLLHRFGARAWAAEAYPLIRRLVAVTSKAQ